MSNLLTRIDGIDGLFHQLWRSDWQDLPEARDVTLRPRVDIHENDERFIIEAELPGVHKEDLSIEVEKQTLILSAKRTLSEKRTDETRAIHRERYAESKYHRTFSLGEDVDTDQIQATLSDGVLEIVVPKAQKALPRRISIN